MLVIGAYDVVSPAARTDTSSRIFGMLILDVDVQAAMSRCVEARAEHFRRASLRPMPSGAIVRNEWGNMPMHSESRL